MFLPTLASLSCCVDETVERLWIIKFVGEINSGSEQVFCLQRRLRTQLLACVPGSGSKEIGRNPRSIKAWGFREGRQGGPRAQDNPGKCYSSLLPLYTEPFRSKLSHRNVV